MLSLPTVTVLFPWRIQKDAYKASWESPPVSLGCHSSWNRITDPSWPPARPTRVLLAASGRHHGKARDGCLLAFPAYRNPAPQQGPLEPRPQMSSGLSTPLSPPRSRLKRTDRADGAWLEHLEEPRGSSWERRVYYPTCRVPPFISHT